MSFDCENPQFSKEVKKRQDYIRWDDYFMSIALLSAKRSKDPCTQVGACIVNQFKKIVGIGYNGMPNGCSDDDLPWNRNSENKLDIKYLYTCHAEMNAVVNKNTSDLKDCIIYVTLFPCNECTKIIIQTGIKEIVFMSDKYHDGESATAARILLKMAGVKTRKFKPTCSRITLDLEL